MDELLKRTADCSGSDLKELCRNAAMIPIREYVRSVQKDGDGTDGNQLLDVDIAVSGQGVFSDWILTKLLVEYQYKAIDIGRLLFL